MAKTYNNPYANRGSYFPHYICVQDDEILGELYQDLGIMGYGVYYRLLELLRNSMVIGRREYKPTLIIKQIGCDEDLLDSVIFNYNLFDVYEEENKIYLQSRELTEYANYVEERRKKRAKAARAAAMARWGKTEGEDLQSEDDEDDEQKPIPKRTPLRRNEFGQLESIETENKETKSESKMPDVTSDNCTMSMPEVEEAENSSPKEKDSTNSKGKSKCAPKKTLDSEIELMQRDESWLSSIREELSLGEEQLLNLFLKFRTECIRNGKKSHLDLEDAMRHFRSWSKKYLTSKKVKGTAIESERIIQIDIQSKQREEKWQKNKATATKPDDYIRSRGYDPSEVTMVQVLSHRWCENHPPTHPEWIVEYSNHRKQEPIEVPF